MVWSRVFFSFFQDAMSDTFILFKNIDTGRFSIGKFKYILEPVFPGHEDAIAATLKSSLKKGIYLYLLTYLILYVSLLSLQYFNFSMSNVTDSNLGYTTEALTQNVRLYGFDGHHIFPLSPIQDPFFKFFSF